MTKARKCGWKRKKKYYCFDCKYIDMCIEKWYRKTICKDFKRANTGSQH